MKTMNLGSFVNCIWDEKEWILNSIIKLTSKKFDEYKFYEHFQRMTKIDFEEHIVRILNKYGQFILSYKTKLSQICENSSTNNYRLIEGFWYEVYQDYPKALQIYLSNDYYLKSESTINFVSNVFDNLRHLGDTDYDCCLNTIKPY
jgi:hypothetical protein